MAIAVQVTQMEASGQQIYLTFNLVASGNYVTGGDTIDFTKLVAASSNLNAQWAGVVAASLPPINFTVWTAGGNLSRDYVGIQGTAMNNSKIKMNTTKGSTTELAAGAYPADVTADTIQGSATFNKLL